MRRILIAIAWLLGSCALQPLAAQGILPASTGCLGDPGRDTTLFRPDVERDSLQRAELEAHEAVHRAQIEAGMAEGKTCYEMMSLLHASIPVNLGFEVPAYRAQAAWIQQHYPTDPVPLYRVFALWLFRSYEQTLPYAYILAYLETGQPPTSPVLAEPAPSTQEADRMGDSDQGLWRP